MKDVEMEVEDEQGKEQGGKWIKKQFCDLGMFLL